MPKPSIYDISNVNRRYGCTARTRKSKYCSPGIGVVSHLPWLPSRTTLTGPEYGGRIPGMAAITTVQGIAS